LLLTKGVFFFVVTKNYFRWIDFSWCGLNVEWFIVVGRK